MHNDFPSTEETAMHPAYPTAIWQFEPHQKGKLATTLLRGSPVNIAWEIHGDGPIKLMVSEWPPCAIIMAYPRLVFA
jgi:hypothetical protein